jgi:hypothetical protein
MAELDQEAAIGVPLLRELASVPDPRGKNGRRYSAGGLLALVSAAVAGGAQSLRAVADWAAARSKGELLDLGLWRGTAPSEKTIRTLLHRLDGAAVDTAVYGFLRRGAGALAGQAIALDGKTVRGAREEGVQAPHLMSAVTHAGAVTLAQVQVDSKTNEIKALPALLDEFEAPGAVFTMDAMHAQTNAARLIVEEKGADYFVTVKGNQPTLQEAIATHPWLGVSPCRPDGRQGPRPP